MKSKIYAKYLKMLKAMFVDFNLDFSVYLLNNDKDFRFFIHQITSETRVKIIVDEDGDYLNLYLDKKNDDNFLGIYDEKHGNFIAENDFYKKMFGKFIIKK